MTHHILIEGSSSTAGYSDESGKGGFCGRIEHHFAQYSQEHKRRNNWNGAKQWVYTQNFARVGRLLPSWVDYLPNHINEVLGSTHDAKRVKTLGIFVLEAHPLGAQQQYGNRLFDLWRKSLESIEAHCSDGVIDPIFVQMPAPVRNIGERGLETHEQFVDLARKSAYSLNAPLVNVAAISELDHATHMADDGMHPNAQGHEVLYQYLRPILYDHLELKPLD